MKKLLITLALPSLLLAACANGFHTSNYSPTMLTSTAAMLATLDMPANKYYVTANVRLMNMQPGSAGTVECAVGLGSLGTAHNVLVRDFSVLSLQHMGVLSGSGSKAFVWCNTTGASGQQIRADQVQLNAISLNSITVQ